MVAQNRKTTQQREVTHDRETGSGANTAPLQYGNHPHGLPDSNVSRADFSNRQALLAKSVPTPRKVLINQGLRGGAKKPL